MTTQSQQSRNSSEMPDELAFELEAVTLFHRLTSDQQTMLLAALRDGSWEAPDFRERFAALAQKDA